MNGKHYFFYKLSCFRFTKIVQVQVRHPLKTTRVYKRGPDAYKRCEIYFKSASSDNSMLTNKYLNTCTLHPDRQTAVYSSKSKEKVESARTFRKQSRSLFLLLLPLEIRCDHAVKASLSRDKSLLYDSANLIKQYF